jgi:hypothetical protein
MLFPKYAMRESRSCDALVAVGERGAPAATYARKPCLWRQDERGEGAAHTSGDEGVAATFPHHEP